MNTISLIIVDDHQIVRDGIKAMFMVEKGIKILGEASESNELYNLLEKCTPDVIILDLSLPGKTGVEITAELVAKNPATKILILTANTDEKSILDSIQAGASGFLNKDTSKEEFLTAIQAVYNGEGYFGEKLTKIIYKSYIQHVKMHKENPQESLLSEREIQIVKLFADGLISKEIGDMLCISPRTVETHKANILEKLKLKNTIELIKYAIKNGIIEI